jgi:hypothetical protein
MLNNVIIGLNLKFKGIFMKNIIITSVAALAVLAFAGCAPKKSCAKTCDTPKPVAAPVVKAAPAPAPAPVVTPAPAPAPVVQEVEPVVVPAIDAKEAAVQ